MSILWDCHGAHIPAPRPAREETPDAAPEGDPGWVEVHAELLELHVQKSSTYGSPADPMANYVETSEKWGDCDEATAARRIDEKMTRARNLILAGRADEVEEWPDIAALALGCEALRRRRM